MGAAVDISQGVVPFSWLFKNFAANVMDGRADSFGTDGPHFYVGAMLVHWNTAAIVLGPLALVGARRYPALFLAAVVHLLAHTLIGHKEYRFILLTVASLTLLAALGFADALQWITSRLPPRKASLAITLGLAFWLSNSLFLAFGEKNRVRWFKNYPELAATAEAGHLPGLCGLALYGVHFSRSGGYSYLHRRVPLYHFPFETDVNLPRSSAAFNAILAPPAAATSLPAAYRPVRCFEPVVRDAQNMEINGRATCLFVRSGACSRVSRIPTINEDLRRRDE